MGAWGPCKGTNAQICDWLVHASTRLSATVELCEEHGITAAMHESGLASIIKSKLNVEMTKEVTEEICKQMTPSGFFESSLMIPLLIKYFEKKTLVYSLLVNVDAMSLRDQGKVDHYCSVLKNKNQSGKPGGAQHTAQGGSGRGGGGVGKSGGGRGGKTGGGGGKGSGGGGNGSGGGSGASGNGSSGNGSGGGSRTSGGARGGSGRPYDPSHCEACKGNHTYMFYCPEFICADIKDRFLMVAKQKSCARCLTMKANFACNEGGCGQAGKDQ
jgi:hypothetical protein